MRFALETSRGDFGRLLSDAHRYCDRARLGAIHERVSRPYALIREAFAQALARGEIRPVDLDVTLATIVADMVISGTGADAGS